MNTPGLALAVLALSAGGASATDFDNPAHAASTAALPWRNAPAEADSFAGVVATGTAPARAWASPPAFAMAPVDTFDADPARRAAIEPPPPPTGGDMTSVAAPLDGIIPVPEPSIFTLLLSGLCALGLIGLRRRLH